MRIDLSESDSVKRAIFITELKNRFRCMVELNGEEVVCYVPSSCRLSNFINLEGCKVLLKKTSLHSDLEYMLFAFESAYGLILLNLPLANQVITSQLSRRNFSFLGRRKNVRREFMVEGYRCDLFIEDTKTIIEVKTVLTQNRVAHFPTVQSKRANEQLQKITQLISKGYQVCYLFVSLSSQVETILLDVDDTYNKFFSICVDKGMTYSGCSLIIEANEIKVYSNVDIEIVL